LLTKCANPSCSSRFKRLREGRLLRVEKADSRPSPERGRSASDRKPEYYWLCGVCSGKLNLAFDRGAGIVLIPIANSIVSRPPATPARLRADSVAEGTSSERLGYVSKTRGRRSLLEH